MTGGEKRFGATVQFRGFINFSPSVSCADSSLVRGSQGAAAPVPFNQRFLAGKAFFFVVL